ncbi:MAG: thiamine phosphate synthase [Candidatus Pelagibacter sp.]|nr:thiamine phosphate synthase [Candidatus Pelagibacter sp.]
MKQNRRFIYLISPSNIIEQTFYKDLIEIFKSNKIAYFQLRLKNTNNKRIILIGKKIMRICKKFKVKFIINDNPKIAKLVSADGCHLGQKDTKILIARKILKKKIIGVTCHNSVNLVNQAINLGADYIAIGAFYKSDTKKTTYLAKINLIKNVKKITKLPIVAIGGIDSINFRKLLLHKANFLAISGYIWNNKKLSPNLAIKKLFI